MSVKALGHTHAQNPATTAHKTAVARKDLQLVPRPNNLVMEIQRVKLRVTLPSSLSINLKTLLFFFHFDG